ncbi:MAG: MaoC family dehydratase [Thermodesulfobacteriota bacterium]
MSWIRKKAIDGISVGDQFRITRTFTEADVQQFAAITRDYNPIHFDDRFVAAKGIDRRICHGLLVGGMVTEIGGQIGWLASGIDFRFKKPVYIGDTITCTLTIQAVGENYRAQADAVFTNGSGDVVLTAHIRGRLPNNIDRDVLQQMMAEGDPTNGLMHQSEC